MLRTTFFIGQFYPGIFEFADDRLRICLDLDAKSRPDTFTPRTGSRDVVLLLERDRK